MDNNETQNLPKNKLMPIGDLFKNSFALYKEKFNILIRLLSVSVVLEVLYWFLWIFKERIFSNVFLTILITPLMLAGAIVILFTQFFVIFVIKESDPHMSIKELLRIGLNRGGSYVWVALLTALIVCVGFLLLVVPGIIFSVWFSLSLYVFVWEDTRGMNALYRSKELVKGYWWPVLGRLLLFGIIGGVVNAIPGIGSLIKILFVMPLGLMYGYLIYQNLKALKS